MLLRVLPLLQVTALCRHQEGRAGRLAHQAHLASIMQNLKHDCELHSYTLSFTFKVEPYRDSLTYTLLLHVPPLLQLAQLGRLHQATWPHGHGCNEAVGCLLGSAALGRRNKGRTCTPSLPGPRLFGILLTTKIYILLGEFGPCSERHSGAC